MDKSEFLEVVKKAMPSKAVLKRHGLDEAEIEEIQSAFLAPLRNRTGVGDGGVAGNEVEKMLLEYDCSNLEVGLVCFLEEARTHPDGKVVALCEADLIVIRNDGSVAMFDHERPDVLAMECARDSLSFLDLLTEFTGIVRDKNRWQGRAREAADKCIVLAGGGAYKDFCNLLCGFLDL